MAGDVLNRAAGAAEALSRAAGAATWVALLAACDAPVGGRGAASMDVELDPAQFASARRPAETFVLERTGERCEVTMRVGGAIASTWPRSYACPLELEIGERIRLAGMTCERQSPVAERNAPTVCPDYLTNAERDHRRAVASAAASASARR